MHELACRGFVRACDAGQERKQEGLPGPMACQWELTTSEGTEMGTVFGLVQKGVCALLLFVAVTSFLGFAYWLVERHSSPRELFEVAIVGLGWAAVGCVAYRRGWPREKRDRGAT